VLGCCGERRKEEVVTATANEDIGYALLVINVGASVEAKLDAKVAAQDKEMVDSSNAG
jgi:hypothetical protein